MRSRIDRDGAGEPAGGAGGVGDGEGEGAAADRLAGEDGGEGHRAGAEVDGVAREVDLGAGAIDGDLDQARAEVAAVRAPELEQRIDEGDGGLSMTVA